MENNVFKDWIEKTSGGSEYATFFNMLKIYMSRTNTQAGYDIAGVPVYVSDVTFADNKEVPAIAIKTTVIDEPPLSTPAYVQPNREPVEESKPVKKQSKFAREFTNFKKVEKNEV
jgi:hypothetical protein